MTRDEIALAIFIDLVARMPSVDKMRLMAWQVQAYRVADWWIEQRPPDVVTFVEPEPEPEPT